MNYIFKWVKHRKTGVITKGKHQFFCVECCEKKGIKDMELEVLYESLSEFEDNLYASIGPEGLREQLPAEEYDKVRHIVEACKRIMSVWSELYE